MEQVNFTFYKEEFGGSTILRQDAFEGIAPHARAFVSKVTFGRASKGDAEKKAVCACCEVLSAEWGREGIASEHNDGYIVTYDKRVPLPAKLWLAARLYLPAELCYRGVE